MRLRKDYRNTLALVVFSLFLLGAGGGGDEDSERAALMEQQRTLNARIETLRREQDFLLFQKAMYAADSKYLVLDVTRKTGQLKYRNRVLKDFRFSPSKRFPVRTLPAGTLVLSRKAEDKKGRHAMIFGTSLVLEWKQASLPQREAALPFLSLTKKDMQSVFYALEKGAMAYIVK